MKRYLSLLLMLFFPFLGLAQVQVPVTDLSFTTNNVIAARSSGGAGAGQEVAVAAGMFTFFGTPSFTNLNTVLTGDSAAGLAATQTLTNKRITLRTNTVASSATPTINTDTTDEFTITALAAAITSFTTNLSGTPLNGDMLLIRIKDDGTARTLAWGASFRQCGATLPTTTVISKTLYVLFVWNSTDLIWDCVSTAQQT